MTSKGYQKHEKIRDKAKHLLGHLCSYNIDRSPIFIFSNRRGGSTLLMRMLYSQPSTDYVDQPLNLWQWHPQYGRLPHPPYSQFISINSIDKKQLYDYFTDLFSGKIRTRNQWNIADPYYSWSVNQIIVKTHNAKNLVNWFRHNLDIEPLYMTRHPIPVAMSIIKRGWGSQAKAYLENNSYVSSFLDNSMMEKSLEVLQKGTEIERFVLEWFLENRRTIDEAIDENIRTITYEELVYRPTQMSKLICEWFDFSYPEKMSNTISNPSPTTSQESSRVISRRGPSELITRWTESISSRQLERVHEVFQLFDSAIYSAYSATPCEGVCHFGPFSV